jgi:antitoxin CcdA
MQPIIDSSAPKKATNLSINKDLLAEARALKINLSATLEQALTEKVRKLRRKQWLEDNEQAIETCNQLAEENGLFADKHRILC